MWRRPAEFLVLVALAACSATYAQQQPPLPGNSAPSFGGVARESPQAVAAGGRVLGERIKTTPGMICLVCNRPIGEDDYVFRVKGQRVAVHRGNCYRRLLARPDHFLATLRPRGAFLSAGAEEQGVAFGWFLVGLYILSGLVFGALSAHAALHRGRSAIKWFGLGLALNVLGCLLLYLYPPKQREGAASVPPGLHKVPATSNSVACAGCGKMNHPAAEACAGCGAKLHPAMESEVRKTELGNA